MLRGLSGTGAKQDNTLKRVAVHSVQKLLTCPEGIAALMVITTINLKEKSAKLPVNTRFIKNNDVYFEV